MDVGSFSAKRALLIGCGVFLAFVGCQRSTPQSADKSSAAGVAAAPPTIEKCELPGLSNVLHVGDKTYSGSEPHGDEGFASLARLGITTVVSVDGARPDIETAHAHGLKYVHIPIGYDGVPSAAGDSLTRLVRDEEGPIYVHCHHGQHRGPAAAAIACIARGDATNVAALHVLELAGTDKKYAGLWRDVEIFSPPPHDSALPALVEVAEVGSFESAMAQIDRHFDNLKLCRIAKWRAAPDHPDLAPQQESLIIKEGFREAARDMGERGERFSDWLADAERQAEALEYALRSEQIEAAESAFQELNKSCQQCHQEYRNSARSLQTPAP